MRTIAIQCTDNRMGERVVLLTPVYCTHAFNDGQIAIRSAMNAVDGHAELIWLPVFTEWWDEQDS